MKKSFIAVAALATLGTAGAAGTHKASAVAWGPSTGLVAGKAAYQIPTSGTPTYTLQDVYRLYNKNTGEHFYTASAAERNSLQAAGWSNEGIGWIGATSGTPVYRVYNPNAKGGDHYYTMSKFEAQTLVNQGWKWDNGGKAAFYSAGDTNLNVAYNPNATSGAHNYTTNSFEQSTLLNAGWKFGAVAWKVEGLPTMKTTGVTINLKSSSLTVHQSDQTPTATTGTPTPFTTMANIKNVVVNGKVYSAQTLLNSNNKAQRITVGSANFVDGAYCQYPQGGAAVGGDPNSALFYLSDTNQSGVQYSGYLARKIVTGYLVKVSYADTSGNNATATYKLNVVK